MENFSPLELEEKLDVEFLLKNHFVPLKIDEENKEVILLTQDPLNLSVRYYLSPKIPYKLKIFLADENTLNYYAKFFKREDKNYKSLEIEEESIEKLKEIAFEAPVIKYLNQLLNRAISLRTTDIHIEPTILLNG